MTIFENRKVVYLYLPLQFIIKIYLLIGGMKLWRKIGLKWVEKLAVKFY